MTLDLNNLDNFCSKKMMRFSRSWSFVLPFHMGELNQKKGPSNISANTVNSLMGVFQISSDGDEWMGQKYIYIYSWAFQPHPKKSLDQKLSSKKSHVEFPSLTDWL